MSDAQGDGTVISIGGKAITEMTKEELSEHVKALRIKRGITSQTRKAAGGGGGGSHGPRAKKVVDLSDAEEL